MAHKWLLQSNLRHYSGPTMFDCILVKKAPSDIVKIYHECLISLDYTTAGSSANFFLFSDLPKIETCRLPCLILQMAIIILMKD